MPRTDRSPEKKDHTPLTEQQLLSLHGRVLLFIHRNRGVTSDEIAKGLSLSTNTIWSVIGDLRREGMIIARRRNRRHYYEVDTEAPVRHPALHSVKVGTILGDLMTA